MGEHSANFYVMYLLTHLSGLTLVGLMISWLVQHMGGFSWSDASQNSFFNYHPLFMTIGMIYFLGTSTLIYRGARQLKKMPLKIMHAALHFLALLFAAIGLYVVFENHAVKNIPHLYSLHSWIGIATIALMVLQYVIGFVTYLAPGMSMDIRVTIMPLHRFFGLMIFCLAAGTCLLGLTEKAIFSISDYGKGGSSSGNLMNLIGVIMVAYTGLTVYLTSETAYRRKTEEEQTPLISRN
ncbi:hypothetical protein ACFFRR_010754 [Megaselia abdita]